MKIFLKRFLSIWERNKELGIKNNIAENVFIIGSSELHGNIWKLNMDGLIFTDFQKQIVIVGDNIIPVMEILE